MNIRPRERIVSTARRHYRARRKIGGCTIATAKEFRVLLGVSHPKKTHNTSTLPTKPSQVSTFCFFVFVKFFCTVFDDRDEDRALH